MLLRPRSWLSSTGTRRGTRLRVSAAHDEWNHVGIALAAMEEGFFAEEGLTDLEVIAFPEEDTAELLDREVVQVDLLAKGIVDIAIDPRTTFVLEARDRGQPTCIVAARRKNHAFVVVGQKDIDGLEDLRGKTAHINAEGGATDVMLRQVLKDSGLEPDKDVKFTYTGGDMHDSNRTVAEFRAGRGGPVMLTTFKGEIEGLVKEGYPILADLRVLYPSRHDRVTGANLEFAERNPEVVKGFLKGMIRGCNWVLDPSNATRFKEVLVDVGYLTTQREERNFDGLFEAWQTRVSRNLTLPQDGIELIIKEEKKAGKISPSLQPEDVLRLDALQQAQRELQLDPTASG